MGLGSFLKRATTIPSKGPLGFIGRPARKVFGENMLDEIGMVGGFMVGGPAGAAAGSAAGNGIHTQNVGKAAMAGAKGYAMGTGAQGLGMKGGTALAGKLPFGLGGSVPGAAGAGGAATPGASAAGGSWAPGIDGGWAPGASGAAGGGAAPSAGGIGARMAKAPGDVLGWLTDKEDGLARQQLLMQGLQTGAGIYAGAQEGKAQDEELKRLQRIRALYSPHLGSFLSSTGG